MPNGKIPLSQSHPAEYVQFDALLLGHSMALPWHASKAALFHHHARQRNWRITITATGPASCRITRLPPTAIQRAAQTAELARLAPVPRTLRPYTPPETAKAKHERILREAIAETPTCWREDLHTRVIDMIYCTDPAHYHPLDRARLANTAHQGEETLQAIQGKVTKIVT